MKITGKNSLLYWCKYPLLIYVVLFILGSLWTCGLMIFYLISGNLNSFISVIDAGVSSRLLRFKIPLLDAVIQTSDSVQNLFVTILGILIVCLVLLFVYRLLIQFTGDRIFTSKVVRDIKILGIGIIAYGIAMVLQMIFSGVHQMNITSPLIYILVGIVLLFIKEIIGKGKILQDQTDLTI